MAGGRPLVITPGEKGAGDVAQTYRAQNDATFTRYERLIPGGAFWRARTTDGATYTFGDPDHTNGSKTKSSPCTTTSDEYAPLTRVKDSFGNSVDYYYEAGVPGECRLAMITWGESQNPAAGVAEFARVKLNYTIPTACSGSYIGSQTSYRTGTKIVTGASRLDTIVVTAYPPGVPTQPVHTRTIQLTYDSKASTCIRVTHSAYRSLASIQETASGVDSPSVTLPAMTFAYGSANFGIAPLDWSSSSMSMPWGNAQFGGENYNLGWGYRFDPYASGSAPSPWPTVEAMMLDIDGDGLQDRVVSEPFDDATGRHHCGAKWFKNEGNFTFSSTGTSIPMPTLKWASAIPGQETCDEDMYSGSLQPNTVTSTTLATESCSLNYQLTNFVNSSSGSVHACRSGSNWCNGQFCFDPTAADFGKTCTNTTLTASPTYFAYRWFDIDGDGLTDLVASPATGSAYDLQWGQGLCAVLPVPEPKLFGNFPYCPSTPYVTPANERAPTMCGGMYPWFVYLNHGNGQFGAAPADPGFDSASPAPDKILYQPIPLEADNGDSSVTASPIGADAGTLDLDGDGHFDGIYAPNQAATWQVFRDGYFRGDSSHFVPETLNIPFHFTTDGEWLSSNGYSVPDVNGFVYPVSKAGVLDLNGDGLPDHWTSVNTDASADVEFNDGVSFRSPHELTTTARPGNDGILGCPASGCTGSRICHGPGNTNCFTVDAIREDWQRVLDVDLDGRPDVVKENGFGGAQTTAMNQGGPFSSPNSGGVGFSSALRHRMVVSSNVDPGGKNTWEIRSDMLDLDGDGIPEGITFADHERGDFGITRGRITTPTQPPRLLYQVSNGRGATTSISYAAMSNSQIVERDAGLVMPRTGWVVQSLTTTDSVAGTTSTTSYHYKNPHFSAEGDLLPTPSTSDSYNFRGFDEVTTTAPSGAKTLQTYSYDVDWTGRLTKSVVVPTEHPVSTIDETEWAPFHSACDSSGQNCAITTYQAINTSHWTCNNNSQSVDDCENNYTNFTRESTTLTPYPDASAHVWKQTATRTQLGTSATPQKGDRISRSDYIFVDDTNNYRLLPSSTSLSVIQGGTEVLVAKSSHGYDPNNLVALEDQKWLDASGDLAITKRSYDMTTGNVLQRWKPIQNAASSTYASYTYDSRKLFVTGETNELGQQLAYVYEYGTGTTLETQGPNTASCVQTSCPPGTLTIQDARIRVDGLGRTIERYATFSDNGFAYTPYKVETFTYNDATLPSSVTHQNAISVNGSGIVTYAQSKAEADGHGRPTKSTTYTVTLPADQVTTYHYGNNGTLDAVSVPDPTANSAAQVTFTYSYDSLGRATSIRRPDSSVLLNQSGVDMTYDGLTTTSQEVVGGGGGAPARTVTTKDPFGRLVEVDEEKESSPLTWATTLYGYDAADRVHTITDPEQQVTTINYDFAGHRSEIDRANQVWSFTYDKNVTAARTPSSAPPDVRGSVGA